jgi:hypothetical protein
MSSFACPHYDTVKDGCLRLKTDCVPGRRGCVLRSKSVFAFLTAERVCERKSKRRTNCGGKKSKIGVPRVRL